MVIPDATAFVVAVCVVARVTEPMVSLFASPVDVKEVFPVPVEITIPYVVVWLSAVIVNDFLLIVKSPAT